ncbi:MAG: large conductance mechanosensitive channel protein MscL [Clostridia bacterium]|nr:large conductance mechanosensitive channel protein MscL [Clostridia bacterium]
MKKFFEEFKKFITRGNIVDMAVGVIVGGAFTAIVNGLSNFILKPIINYLLALMLGKNALSEVYTFLGDKAYLEDGTLDLANCFYIDWGAFINAVINFLIIAFVLFTIVKVINHVKESQDKLENVLSKGKPTKEQRKELKANGIKLSDKDAVKAYLDAKAEEEAKAKAEEEAKAAEQARLDRLANPTTEDLLKEILATMKKEA